VIRAMPHRERLRHGVQGMARAMLQAPFGTRMGSSRVGDSGGILRSTFTIGPESPCVVATFSPEW